VALIYNPVALAALAGEAAQRRAMGTPSATLPEAVEPDIPAALALCGEAGLTLDMMDTSFFLGRETLIPKLGSSMAYWRALIFVAMFRNAGSATAFFKIPSNRVVELGSQVVL
jgi:K+ transporter